ncbi:MAG: Gfo/Idh/MocA family protein [bacterium]
MKTIHWGIIGCGDVTEVKSGPAFNKIAGSKLIAVMRRDGEKARDYAQRHGVPKWFNDAEKLIHDSDVNAIYVATPPDSHAEYAIKAAKAGKPVYVEKPMACTYEDIVCANFSFTSNVLGNGVWCFTVSEKSKMDRIAIVGSRGTIEFSTFDREIIRLVTEHHVEEFQILTPQYIQQPLIQTIVDELQARGKCPSTGITAARTNRVMDEIMQEWRSTY